MKQVIEVKSDGKRHGRDIRYLHFLVSKRNRNQTGEDHETEEDAEELLSDSVPCETYQDLQVLDGKLISNVRFFTKSVGAISCKILLQCRIVISVFQVEVLVETECFDIRGKRLSSIVRQLLRTIIDDNLLTQMTWGGMSRETKNGKSHNFSLKYLKGVVKLTLSKS